MRLANIYTRINVCTLVSICAANGLALLMLMTQMNDLMF